MSASIGLAFRQGCFLAEDIGNFLVRRIEGDPVLQALELITKMVKYFGSYRLHHFFCNPVQWFWHFKPPFQRRVEVRSAALNSAALRGAMTHFGRLRFCQTRSCGDVCGSLGI